MIVSAINRNFGTWRGAVRLGLSYVEIASGQASISRPVAEQVRRLVFVCHGNICRSAYAEVLARKAGLATASFGLSTTSGLPAHPPVVQRAQARGLDLTPHVTTAVEDHVALPGDYLLGMEVRHMRKLAAIEPLTAVPRGLLGSHAPFPLPHLHDPFGLDPAYMDVCLNRIEAAVARLAVSFPGARVS